MNDKFNFDLKYNNELLPSMLDNKFLVLLYKEICKLNPIYHFNNNNYLFKDGLDSFYMDISNIYMVIKNIKIDSNEFPILSSIKNFFSGYGFNDKLLYSEFSSFVTFEKEKKDIYIYSDYCIFCDGVLTFVDVSQLSELFSYENIYDVRSEYSCYFTEDSIKIPSGVKYIKVLDKDIFLYNGKTIKYDSNFITNYLKGIKSLDLNINDFTLARYCTNLDNLTDSFDSNQPLSILALYNVKNLCFERPKNIILNVNNVFNDYVESITFGDDVYKLKGTFSGLPNLKKCDFNNCYFSDKLFHVNPKIEEIILSSDTKYIFDDFCNSKFITKIIIPENVLSIDLNAFSGCSKLKEFVFMGNKITDFYFFNSLLESGSFFKINNHDVFLLDNRNIEFTNYDKFNNYELDCLNISFDTIDKLINNGFDEELFKSNFDYLTKSSGLSEDKMDSFIDLFKENRVLFDKPIASTMYFMFNKLKSENIIDEDILKRLYFDFDFNDEDDFNNKLQDFIISKSTINPILLSLLECDENELRDKLIFVKTLILSKDDNYLDKLVHIRDLLTRSVFDTIVKNDNDKFNNSKYNYTYGEDVFSDVIFKGIRFYLTRELEKINPKLIILFNDDESMKKAILSLNTVKNWNSIIDKRERAIYLKNEIIGRVLYSMIRVGFELDNNNLDRNFNLSLDYFNNFSFKMFDFEKNKDLFIKYFNFNDFNKKNRNINPLYSQQIINNIIKKNPYFFDMLRNDEDINDSYIKLALSSGYIFDSKSDKDRYGTLISKVNKNDYNDIDAIARKVLNDIGTSVIPDDMISEYISDIRDLIKKYFDNPNDVDAANNVFRNIDVFLNDNNTLEYQFLSDSRLKRSDNNIYEEYENKLFDFSLDDDSNRRKLFNDRMSYCLFNCNKLAHNISDINMRKLELDMNDYLTSSEQLKNLEVLKNGLQGYSDLFSLGITPKMINSLLDNRSSGLNNELNNINNEYDGSDEQLDQLNYIRNGLCFALDRNLKLPNNNEEFFKIVNKFKNISKIDKKIRKEVIIDSERQKMFFDTKASIAQQMVNDLFNTIDFDNNLDPISFFKENGFIIDCQEDITSGRGNELLTIYNPSFNECFSIHMKNLSSELMNKFSIINSNNNGRDLLYCTNTIGLTEFKQEDLNITLPFIKPGFNKVNIDKANELSLMTINCRVRNFLAVDCKVIKEEIKNGYVDEEYLLEKLPIKNSSNVLIEIDEDGNTISLLEAYGNSIGYDFNNHCLKDNRDISL